MSIEFGAIAEDSSLIEKTVQPEDRGEKSLRPRFLNEYIGQSHCKEHLAIYIKAAKQRGEALDHVLLYGPPGLGKTTLSCIIANELGVNLRTTSGPAIQKPGDLAALLTNLDPHDVLFIDEIHRLDKSIEEILYPAMEDHALDIIVGKGPSSNSIRLELPPFTLIGATTRSGQLSAPLRDRFGISFRLELYNEQELAEIVSRSAGILGIPIEKEGAYEIARRSRGTPRIANRLLKRVRDFSEVKGEKMISQKSANEALTSLDIDPIGLTGIDRLILKTIADSYSGGPVGLETLAMSIGEEAVTLEDVYEPFLVSCGLISRTPRGRCLTEKGKQYIA